MGDHALTCVKGVEGGPRTHLCEGGGGGEHALTCVRGVEGGTTH